MTEREKQIYELIEKDPMISQAEIARLLKITRTSVAVHISNLMKKGNIKGKGYITRSEHPITVIGGANIDIQGQAESQIIMKDSNPGYLKTSLGGVARNIAENMALLGLPTRLITAVGQDINGRMIKENALLHKIDMDDSLIVANKKTSTYLYVLDEQGEMVVAISDMKVTDFLDTTFLSTKTQKINKSAYTVLDANLLVDSLQYLAEHLNETKLILDTVSAKKSLRAKDVLHRFYAIKSNRTEAEVLLDMKLNSKTDIKIAGAKFLEMGIKKVIITLGQDGVYYTDNSTSFFRNSFNLTPINVTGAGDAFTAGLVYGLTHNLESKNLIDFCMGASAITLLSPYTIASSMSETTVLETIQKYSLLK
ncbi:MAG: kinase [Alkaliphilus sp.]|nr:winged helix-turn-helix transcriptional regulator [bacterium AH-315-K05]PHS31280.1 MAG: kinase [Alkaliphilus sp.]